MPEPTTDPRESNDLCACADGCHGAPAHQCRVKRQVPFAARTCPTCRGNEVDDEGYDCPTCQDGASWEEIHG